METRDKPESGSAVTPESPSDASQSKNNVLELSFKTRRHFVFCSTATSPRRKPILGPGQGMRPGLKLDPLQDMLISPSVALPLSSSSSSSAMILEDHDYSSSVKRGRGLETGSCSLPVLQQLTKQKMGTVMYSGLESKMLTESVGDDVQPRHQNPMSDLMQAMCEEVLQVECEAAAAAGLGDKTNARSADVQDVCDSHSSKTFLSPSSFSVKVQKVDAYKEVRAVGFDSSSSTQSRNHIVRASWSSSTSNKQSSMGKSHRSVTSAYPDCDSSHGVKVGPSTSTYQLFNVEMGSSSSTTSGLSTFCDDQAPFLSERPASSSLDSAQTGMILPSPFLIQTGLEKTLDFAEFHPMSPSNKDWDNGFCCPNENGLETTLYEHEIAKTCDVSGGISSFDGQDFPLHQNLFSSQPASAKCVRTQQGLCAASDIKTTSARTKQPGAKWCGKRQEHVNVTFDPLTFENLNVRRRKPLKRQLDSEVPVEICGETANDLDRKRARHTLSVNKAAPVKREPFGNEFRISGAMDEQKVKRPRKSKKLREQGNVGDEEFDHNLHAFEKMDNLKRYRIKSELGVDKAYADNKDSASTDRFNDPTYGRAMEQERPSRRTGHSVSSHQKATAHRSVDFCDVLSTMLDRWLEYLMTSQDVMRQQAIDDAKSFGYNDDALEMVSNGDLEVWRILEEMEPDFVRSGIEKYFT